VRRGHFVEGLSGAQFALAGAIDRLRGARLEETPLDGFSEQSVQTLSAADPANPYGALLPWPETGGGARFPPKRLAGAWVILVAGKPALYLGAGGRHLMTFPRCFSAEGGELELALSALRRLPRRGRRRHLLVQVIDGEPATRSSLREAMLAAGFEPDYDALTPGVGGTNLAGSQ
jgi:ATP-dependent Lhr-like helicase